VGASFLALHAGLPCPALQDVALASSIVGCARHMGGSSLAPAALQVKERDEYSLRRYDRSTWAVSCAHDGGWGASAMAAFGLSASSLML
jgi:hypothetical protein